MRRAQSLYLAGCRTDSRMRQMAARRSHSVRSTSRGTTSSLRFKVSTARTVYCRKSDVWMYSSEALQAQGDEMGERRAHSNGLDKCLCVDKTVPTYVSVAGGGASLPPKCQHKPGIACITGTLRPTL